MKTMKSFFYDHLLGIMKKCLKNKISSYIIDESVFLNYFGRHTCEKDFYRLQKLLSVTDSKVLYHGDAGIEIVW